MSQIVFTFFGRNQLNVKLTEKPSKKNENDDRDIDRKSISSTSYSKMGGMGSNLLVEHKKTKVAFSITVSEYQFW